MHEQDYYSVLRILINSHRLPGESNDELVRRVLSDNSIFTALVNSEPIFSNASLLKALLASPQFISTL